MKLLCGVAMASASVAEPPPVPLARRGADRHARRLIDLRTLALFFDRFDQGIPV
ncbi:hypothetical protein [Burkholderia gladioli]|uniref:hypothetical protein n=1 Tax=Burkholderia gladioli TaxID=28095 RepID=UPI00163E4FEC|nr:hypothetical protein [Burkholderia gladioli]